LPYAGEHGPVNAKILLETPLAAAVHPSPLQLMRLSALPPLRLPAVQENLDLIVAGKRPLEMVVEIKLGLRHDYQVSNAVRLHLCL